jgi:hypothetical protein
MQVELQGENGEFFDGIDGITELGGTTKLPNFQITKSGGN